MYVSEGTSNPVIHMSTTIATLKFELSFLNMAANLSFRELLLNPPRYSYISRSSSVALLAIIAINGISSSHRNISGGGLMPSLHFFSANHSGYLRSNIFSSLYAIFRLEHVIIAFWTLLGSLAREAV